MGRMHGLYGLCFVQRTTKNAPTISLITLSRSYDAMGRLSEMLVLPAKAIPGQSITAQIIPGQPPEEPKPEIPHLMDLSRHHRYNRIGQLDHIEHLRLHPPAQPWQPPQRQTHRSQRYGYDAQQRLEFEGVHSVGTDALELGRERVQREQHWHYDRAGNRIHPDDTRYRPLQRAAPGNRLHRSAQARYRHDAWGNVVQIDHTAGPHKGQQVRLAYDGEHRLLASERIHTGTDGQRHSVLTCYHYDPMSRRMGKQHLKRIPQADGQKSEWRIQSSLWFGWDGDRMVTMQNERQASTTIYEPNSFVPMLRVDKQLQADERRSKGETRTYHVHCNHLGTPEALIDHNDLQLVWQIELDPWGQTQREYNPNNMLQPIRMQGQQLDAETGLFYNRYRYYDPAGGRYVTQDPIGLKGGVNKFIYPTNPNQMIDHLGLQPRPGNLSWGNWCGGGWSGGYETKIILPNSKPPIDSLDVCCMVHDYCYAEREKNKKQNLGKCDQSLKDACDKQMMDCVNALPANTKDWPMPASKNVNGLILPNQQADVFRDRLKTLFGNDNLRRLLTP